MQNEDSIAEIRPSSSTTSERGIEHRGKRENQEVVQ